MKVVQWDIVLSAPSESAVIGVLAALVFGAVILLLQQPPQPTEPHRYRYAARALTSLIYVFFVLVIASFLFSVISGERNCQRAFLEGTVAAGLFALGGVETFLSLCWLVAAHRVAGQQITWIKALTALLVVTAWAFTAITLYDAVEIIDPTELWPTAFTWWGSGLLLLSLTAGGAATWIAPVRRWLQPREEGLFVWTTVTSIVAAAAAIAAFSLITVQEAPPPTVWLWFRFTFMGALAVLFALYLANLAVIQELNHLPPASAQRTSQ